MPTPATTAAPINTGAEIKPANAVPAIIAPRIAIWPPAVAATRPNVLLAILEPNLPTFEPASFLPHRPSRPVLPPFPPNRSLASAAVLTASPTVSMIPPPSSSSDSSFFLPRILSHRPPKVAAILPNKPFDSFCSRSAFASLFFSSAVFCSFLSCQLPFRFFFGTVSRIASRI
ncbi:hypothetical protein D3C80_1474310 [compost metagenome]